MTFDDALDNLIRVDAQLDLTHFRRLHRGSCVRKPCLDLMSEYSSALSTLKQAFKDSDPRPEIPAFRIHGKDGFFDRESGAHLCEYEGLYSYQTHDGRQAIMYTWPNARNQRQTICLSTAN